MQRMKYWCRSCDHVAKSAGATTCPFCRQPMRNMGPKWRVGKKGHRVDWQENPYGYLWWWADLRGIEKLLGNIIYDKRTGKWRRA